MDEKREHLRKLYEVEVEVIFNNGNTRPGFLLNISPGGAFVKVDPVPPFGSKITLKVSLPGVPDACDLPCIVRWTKPGEGAGVQFEYLRPIEVWALNKLMRKLGTEKES